MELETTAPSFSKMVTNICFHHMYTVSTNRTSWKHSHVYCIDRGCPRGHMLVTHWTKNTLCRNPPGDSKHAPW